MLAFHWLRAVALAAALIGVGFNPASAKHANKKSASRHAPAATLGPVAGVHGPARFFTINEVLAKADARARNKFASAAAPAIHTDASVVTASRPRAAVGDEPFGLFTFRAPEGLLWVKWRGVQMKLRDEADEISACRTDPRTCTPAARRFLAVVNAARNSTGRTRIDLVNRAINASVRYASDFAQHGVADLWSAPLATLAAGRGDCEDYAIAKYALLLDAGVPARDLRLVLVRDRAVRQDHAVLAVRDGAQWLILDNRNLELAEATRLSQFLPLFAIDHRGVNLFAAPYVAQAATPEPAVESVPLPATAPDQFVSWTSSAPSSPYLL